MATTRKAVTPRKTTRSTKASKPAPAAARKPAAASLGEIGKLLQRLKIPGIDVAAVVESQRRDLEALAEANRQAYEGIKALAKRRNEILKDALAEWQEAIKDTGGGDPIGKRVEMAKKGIAQAVANFRELAEMEAKARKQAWKVLQDRFKDNLASLQKLVRPK